MDEVAKRELNWWEHYPLHQVWCNDLCPLVPRFEYRYSEAEPRSAPQNEQGFL